MVGEIGMQNSLVALLRQDTQTHTSLVAVEIHRGLVP
jgi:hypothetical protein